MSTLKDRPRKTLDDYMNLPDEARAEPIEGELYISPSPTSRHQRVSARIFSALSGHAATHALGEALYAPLDILLPSGDVVQPDVIFVSTANLAIVQDRIRGVPDLLV